MKAQIMKLSTAENIIARTQKNLIFFKKKKNPCKMTLSYVIKDYYYDNYDIRFFFPKLKPYILGKKDISLLKEELFLRKNESLKKIAEEDKKRNELSQRMAENFKKGNGKMWQKQFN